MADDTARLSKVAHLLRLLSKMERRETQWHQSFRRRLKKMWLARSDGALVGEIKQAFSLLTRKA